MGSDDNITGDNACRWNLTALLNMTGLRKEDLLFVQFQPEVRGTHHCVLLHTGLLVQRFAPLHTYVCHLTFL